MPDIRPVSDLRNKFKAIEKDIQTTGGPIFLTTKGRCNMVLVSAEYFDRHFPSAFGGRPVQATPVKESVFGSVVSELRNHHGLSQEQLAEVTGVAVDTICDIEMGCIEDAVIPNETIAALAKGLEVSMDTLQAFAKNELGSADKFLLDILRTITRG